MIASGQTILVTGAAGFVGAQVVRKSLNLGLTTIALTRSSSNIWRLIDMADSPKLLRKNLDIIDEKAVQQIVQETRPDMIIHCAVYGGFANQTDARRIFLTNTTGTLNLLEAALRNNVRLFVNIGSSSEYGHSDLPMSELMPLRPYSIYGATKASSTLIANAFALEYRMNVQTLRIFSPYGPLDDPGRLIPSCIEAALSNLDFQATGGKQSRDYLFIDDVIEAIFSPKLSEVDVGRVWNIGSGISTKIEDVICKIYQITNSGGSPIFNALAYRDADKEARLWSADPAISSKELAWTAKINLEDGLRATIDWHINRKTDRVV